MSYYTGKVGTQPPDTNWIRCPCCHLKFSSRSLPFHIEACIRTKSGSWEILSCPICNDQVKGSEFKGHLTNGCVFRHTSENRAPRLGNDYDSQLEVNATQELVPCPHCERRFATHRLSKHVTICNKNNNTPKRKVFNSSSKRTPVRGAPSAHWTRPPQLGSNDLSFSVGNSGRGNGGRVGGGGRSGRNQLRPTPTARSQSGSGKLTIGNGNHTSLGNPLVNGNRRTAPRPTYQHH
tara:strand:- start:93 stop:797 length:705 start_codon:yes stop_codon:yes gene_type:complete